MIKYIIKSDTEKSILESVINHGNDFEIKPCNTLKEAITYIGNNICKIYEWKEIADKVTITQVYPAAKSKKGKLVKSGSRFYESLKKIK